MSTYHVPDHKLFRSFYVSAKGKAVIHIKKSRFQWVPTAFKIQMSVSLKGVHNLRKDWSAFAQMKIETE